MPGAKLRSAGAAALLLIVCALPAAAAEPDRPGERSITVSAQGSVTVEPDVGYFQASVVTEAEASRDALARNAAGMTKLLDGLKALGLAPADLQTSAIRLEPRYTLAKDNRTQVLSAYRVTNQLHVIVRDVKRLGEIMDQAVALGANQLGRVSFEIANADKIKDDARLAAIATARQRAELYARAAGVELGPVLRIFEEPQEARTAPLGVQRVLQGSVPIEAGTRTLTSEVQVTWGLR